MLSWNLVVKCIMRPCKSKGYVQAGSLAYDPLLINFRSFLGTSLNLLLLRSRFIELLKYIIVRIVTIHRLVNKTFLSSISFSRIGTFATDYRRACNECRINIAKFRHIGV